MTPPMPPYTGWVLLGYRGRWARGFDDAEAVPGYLREAARALSLRIGLIRQDRRLGLPDPIACLLAYTKGPARYVERIALRDPRALSVDMLERLAAGRPSAAGTPVAGPLYLVCTESRGDRRCARRGRRLVRAFAAAAPGRVWETSHLGGCRYAVNVVRLPDGLYYRQVTRDDVPAIIADRPVGVLVESCGPRCAFAGDRCR
jgi:(2Fe-2S) ferredoxin